MSQILYLPIEIKSRELDGKLLLAYYALNEGHRVIIGEHSKVEDAAHIYPRGIFLAKGYSRGYRKRVLTEVRKGKHYLVELDEEGLVFSDEATYLQNRMNRELLSYIDHVFCWGEQQQRVIVHAYPEFSEKCIVTGNPRFDLLSKKYRGIYQEKANELTKRYGPYILINTRFTLYNTIGGKKEENLTPHGKYIKELYKHFITMIKHLSGSYPSLSFIVRPHPAERKESYIEDLHGLENVYILREGYVIHWLLGAEAVIHHGCTTGIEGYLLDKAVYSFMPVQSSTYDVDLPQDVSVPVTELEEMKILIGRYTHTGKASWQKKKSVLLSEFYAQSDEYSYQRILRHIASESPTRDEKQSLRPYRFKKDARKKVKHMFPSLSSDEITAFFNEIDHIERWDLCEKISTTKLADRLFLLEYHKGDGK